MSDPGSGVLVEVTSDPISVGGDEQVVEVFPSGEAPIVVTVEEECIDIALSLDTGAMLAVIVDISEDPILVEIIETELITLEVGQQGPAGPQGPQGVPGPAGGTIPETKFKHYQILVGTIDGANQIFVLPNADKARNADPGFMVIVLYNGQELLQGVGDDFTVSESGGVGTGYDTVTLVSFAPKPGDLLWSHYVLI